MSNLYSYCLCFEKQQVNDVLELLRTLSGNDIVSIPYEREDGSEYVSIPCRIDSTIAQYLSDEGLTEVGKKSGKMLIGSLWLTIYGNKSYVLFYFGSLSRRMNVLFEESKAVRQIFIDILSQCNGIYGILNRVDYGHIIWFKGQECYVPFGEVFVNPVDPDLDSDFVSPDVVGRVVEDYNVSRNTEA